MPTPILVMLLAFIPGQQRDYVLRDSEDYRTKVEPNLAVVIEVKDINTIVVRHGKQLRTVKIAGLVSEEDLAHGKASAVAGIVRSDDVARFRRYRATALNYMRSFFAQTQEVFLAFPGGRATDKPEIQVVVRIPMKIGKGKSEGFMAYDVTSEILQEGFGLPERRLWKPDLSPEEVERREGGSATVYARLFLEARHTIRCGIWADGTSPGFLHPCPAIPPDLEPALLVPMPTVFLDMRVAPGNKVCNLAPSCGVLVVCRDVASVPQVISMTSQLNESLKNVGGKMTDAELVGNRAFGRIERSLEKVLDEEGRRRVQKSAVERVVVRKLFVRSEERTEHGQRPEDGASLRREK